MQITLGNQQFILLTEKALFWPALATLIIADCHFGKEAVFQRHGIPVPLGASSTDLMRIDKLLLQTNAKEIIFLGDFLHGAITDKQLHNQICSWWQAHREIKMQLIIGNHEKPIPLLQKLLPFDIIKEIRYENLLFSHIPTEELGIFNIAGHLHPVFNVTFGRYGERLPCFLSKPKQLILPAFGSFTGGLPVKPAKGCSIYLITPKKVFLFDNNVGA